MKIYMLSVWKLFTSFMLENWEHVFIKIMHLYGSLFLPQNKTKNKNGDQISQFSLFFLQF